VSIKITTLALDQSPPCTYNLAHLASFLSNGGSPSFPQPHQHLCVDTQIFPCACDPDGTHHPSRIPPPAPHHALTRVPSVAIQSHGTPLRTPRPCRRSCPIRRRRSSSPLPLRRRTSWSWRTRYRCTPRTGALAQLNSSCLCRG
jgi:hypothetical protein